MTNATDVMALAGRLRDLAAKATPGPWQAADSDHEGPEVCDGTGETLLFMEWSDDRPVISPFRREQAMATRDHIAACDPATVTTLCNAVKALEADRERLTTCLTTANEQTEHFERLWYLRLDELDTLQTEQAALKTVMIAAAEEIHRHWAAHCDAEGYGPANLMRRLEEGMPAEYRYTAGAFADLQAERDALWSRNVEILAAEHKLSDSYVRVRATLDAMTPPALDADALYAYVEGKAAEIVAERDALLADAQAVALRRLPLDSMPMGADWSVTVERKGDSILTLSDQGYRGRPLSDEDEALIIGAARHLLSFVGYGMPPSSFDPDDESAPLAQQEPA